MNVINRLIDPTSLVNATNVSTGLGVTLMNIAAMLQLVPEPQAQVLGQIVGIIAFVVTIHTDKKEESK